MGLLITVCFPGQIYDTEISSSAARRGRRYIMADNDAYVRNLGGIRYHNEEHDDVDDDPAVSYTSSLDYPGPYDVANRGDYEPFDSSGEIGINPLGARWQVALGDLSCEDIDE